MRTHFLFRQGRLFPRPALTLAGIESYSTAATAKALRDAVLRQDSRTHRFPEMPRARQDAWHPKIPRRSALLRGNDPRSGGEAHGITQIDLVVVIFILRGHGAITVR